MSAYKKFDPYSVPMPPAKAAKVAKESSADCLPGRALASLAPLAGRPAESSNSSFRSNASLGNGADESHGQRLISQPKATVPTDWVSGLLRMAEKTRPVSVEPKRWLQLRLDGQRFADQWGRQAAALGWSTLDIFGCHSTHPAERFDYMGLVWIIAGAEVVAMGAEVAHLRNSAGIVQRAWKRAADVPRILPWDL